MPGDRPANGRSPPASSHAERSSRGTDGGDGHRGSRSGVVSSRRALRHERQPRRRSRTRRGSRRRRQAPRAFRPGVAVGLRRRSRGVDVAASAPGACRNAPIPANAAGMTCESPGKFLLKRGASVPAIRASRDARRPSRDARRRVKAGLADCRRGRCRRWRRCGPLDQCCIVLAYHDITDAPGWCYPRSTPVAGSAVSALDAVADSRCESSVWKPITRSGRVARLRVSR